MHGRGLLAELGHLGRTWRPTGGGWLALRRDLAPWTELRAALAACDADTYAEARAAAEALRAKAELPLRCAIDQAFFEPAWSRDDAAACVAEADRSGELPPWAAAVVPSLADAALLEALASRAHDAAAVRRLSRHALDAIASLGAAAAPGIAMLLRRAAALPGCAAAEERCLEALGLVGSDQVAALFAELCGTAAAGAAASYFARHPRYAVRALTALAARPTKQGRAAATLLEAAIAAAPRSAEAELAALAPALRARVAPILARTGEASEEAAAAELPAVLADPPWRRSGRRAVAASGGRALDLETIERVPLPRGRRPRAEWEALLPWVPRAALLQPAAALAIAHAWLHRAERREPAAAWLEELPEVAAAGLLPHALGAPGEARIEAGRVLRHLAGRGHAGAIRRAAARYGVDAAAEVEKVLALDPLLDVPASAPELGAFLRIEALPRPRLAAGGRRLPTTGLRHLLEMLAFSAPFEPPYAGIAQAGSALEPESLDLLACAVLAQWLAAGAPDTAVGPPLGPKGSRRTWPLQALASIGGDHAARALGPRVRAWPGERRLDLALEGTGVLERIGSDVALIELGLAAERSRDPALRDEAARALARAAAARGLGPDELGDRLVPDLGPEGGEVVDYGARRFRIGADAELAVLIEDESGKRLRALPRAGRGDDAGRARAAQARLRTLRADVEAVTRAQRARLEQAMASRRRWTAEAFSSYLLGVRALRPLARRLVWASFDDHGLTSFRVAEDLSLASHRDEPFELPALAAVGLPHPLELDPAIAAGWIELFAAYRLAQPFAQLGRPVFLATPAEQRSRALGRFAGVRVSSVGLFTLAYRGWRAAGGAPVTAYTKRLGERRVAVSIEPGLDPRALRELPEQTITRVAIAPGRFGDLDPVAFSELCYELETLRARE